MTPMFTDVGLKILDPQLSCDNPRQGTALWVVSPWQDRYQTVLNSSSYRFSVCTSSSIRLSEQWDVIQVIDTL